VSVIQITVASVVMGAIVALASHFIGAGMGEGRLAALANLAISIPLGAAVFYVVCRGLKVAELEMAGRALVAPARAWLSRQRAKI
jgi:hypothetical protein